MALLRSVIHALWMLLTVIPFAIVILAGAAVGVRGEPLYRIARTWLRLVIEGLRVICGVRWRVIGMENVPTAADGQAAVLLASKHQSTWETFAYPAIMTHPMAYVFKRELLYVPFFGWAMARMDMIHIDRGRRSEAWAKVLKQGKRMAELGNWVIMFPEGTRIARGQKGEYKSGGTRLAVATGVPVVPIAATSARCWPRKSFLLRPGVVDISIGQPIPSVGREPVELMKQVETWIEAEMQRLDPEAYVTPGAGPSA